MSPRKIAAGQSDAAGAFKGALKRGPAAYSFAGDIGDLARVLSETHVPKGFRTVVIPKTPKAEDVLKKAAQFRRVRLRGKSLTEPRARGAGAQAREPAERGRPVEDVILAGLGPARVVEAADIKSDAFQPNARARAILRGREYAEADLRAAGGAFDLDEVRKLLNGVSRQAVDKRVAEGALLVVPGPSGHRRFPTLQFNADGTPVVGLREVCRALNFVSPWAVLNFLCNANDALGGRAPIEVLRGGDVDRVVQAAVGVGVQGA